MTRNRRAMQLVATCPTVTCFAVTGCEASDEPEEPSADNAADSAGSELSPVYDAPPLTAIDWEPGGPLVGVAADGAVVVSADGESDRQDVGKIDGVVTAQAEG